MENVFTAPEATVIIFNDDSFITTSSSSGSGKDENIGKWDFN